MQSFNGKSYYVIYWKNQAYPGTVRDEVLRMLEGCDSDEELEYYTVLKMIPTSLLKIGHDRLWKKSGKKFLEQKG